MRAGELQRVWYAHDLIRCQRRVLTLAPTFEFFDEVGNSLLYCQEKIFAIRDDIRVFADESKQHELLRIKQRNIMDTFGLFDVFDSASGEKLGALQRQGGYFSGYTWQLLDATDASIGSINETGTKLWRRLFKFLPYSFEFRLGDRVTGTFTQQFSFVRYSATMDLSAATGSGFDRRLAFAGALLLMAVEEQQDRR